MKSERVNFYKYFPVSEDATNWGIYIENIGKSEVLQNENYPLSGHPDTHFFTWDNGRYLSSYQMLIITDGQGVFESESAGMISLAPGSIILLYPNEWHRYRPLRRTGWKEYWLGFNGSMVNKLVMGSQFEKARPVIAIRDFGEIQRLYDDAVCYSIEEKPGFQQIVVGILFQIFGHVYYNVKNKTRQSKSFLVHINSAKEIIQTRLKGEIDVPQIARELNVGYAIFRKKFKEFTGLSPKQYQTQVKLNRAKTLLLGSDLPVKSIAFETGFESIYHFSKMFKEKTGYSPTDFRELVKESGKNGQAP